MVLKVFKEQESILFEGEGEMEFRYMKLRALLTTTRNHEHGKGFLMSREEAKEIARILNEWGDGKDPEVG